MKKIKSILYILGLALLLYLSFMAILVPIFELRYVFTMAPYPYILDGECCKYIEFMGLEIRTIYYVALLVIYTIAQLVFVCFGIYKAFMKKYFVALAYLFVPVAMEIFMSLLRLLIYG